VPFNKFSQYEGRQIVLACYPHLALTAVATTSASSYMSLLSETPA
jgi:hypothetical protein